MLMIWSVLFPVIVSFSYIYISQGSAAMHLWCGGTFSNSVIADLFAKCAGERSFKIGQYLAKIWKKFGDTFLWLTVYTA